MSLAGISQRGCGYPRGQMSFPEGVPYLSHDACDIPTPEQNDHTCENITFPLPVIIVRLLHFNILLQEAKCLLQLRKNLPNCTNCSNGTTWAYLANRTNWVNNLTLVLNQGKTLQRYSLPSDKIQKLYQDLSISDLDVCFLNLWGLKMHLCHELSIIFLLTYLCKAKLEMVLKCM